MLLATEATTHGRRIARAFSRKLPPPPLKGVGGSLLEEALARMIWLLDLPAKLDFHSREQ